MTSAQLSRLSSDRPTRGRSVSTEVGLSHLVAEVLASMALQITADMVRWFYHCGTCCSGTGKRLKQPQQQSRYTQRRTAADSVTAVAASGQHQLRGSRLASASGGRIGSTRQRSHQRKPAVSSVQSTAGSQQAGCTLTPPRTHRRHHSDRMWVTRVGGSQQSFSSS